MFKVRKLSSNPSKRRESLHPKCVQGAWDSPAKNGSSYREFQRSVSIRRKIGFLKFFVYSVPFPRSKSLRLLLSAGSSSSSYWFIRSRTWSNRSAGKASEGPRGVWGPGSALSRFGTSCRERVWNRAPLPRPQERRPA